MHQSAWSRIVGPPRPVVRPLHSGPTEGRPAFQCNFSTNGDANSNILDSCEDLYMSHVLQLLPRSTTHCSRLPIGSVIGISKRPSYKADTKLRTPFNLLCSCLELIHVLISLAYNYSLSHRARMLDVMSQGVVICRKNLPGSAS